MSPIETVMVVHTGKNSVTKIFRCNGKLSWGQFRIARDYGEGFIMNHWILEYFDRQQDVWVMECNGFTEREAITTLLWKPTMSRPTE